MWLTSPYATVCITISEFPHIPSYPITHNLTPEIIVLFKAATRTVKQALLYLPMQLLRMEGELSSV